MYKANERVTDFKNIRDEFILHMTFTQDANNLRLPLYGKFRL